MIAFHRVHRCALRSRGFLAAVGSIGVARCLSNAGASPELVLTEIDEEKRVATLTLNRPPANTLSLEMCEAISASLNDIHAQPAVQGLVLASSNPSILSAGLELTELHNPDTERLPKFWRSFQQLYLDLYGSRLATVAAIEGHAPAAGCMLALCCDYRIMAASDGDGRGGKIGLNETLLGIAAPPWLGQLMVRTVGFRTAERSLGLGLLFGPEEALDIGLVDEIVPKEKVEGAAMEEAAKWAKIPPRARVASKHLTRQEFLDSLDRDSDTKQFCRFVQNEKVQANLTRYLESLRKKKKG